MESLKKSLHDTEIDNWLLIYRLGLFETMAFTYGYSHLFLSKECLNKE